MAMVTIEQALIRLEELRADEVLSTDRNWGHRWTLFDYAVQGLESNLEFDPESIDNSVDLTKEWVLEQAKQGAELETRERHAGVDEQKILEAISLTNSVLTDTLKKIKDSELDLVDFGFASESVFEPEPEPTPGFFQSIWNAITQAFRAIADAVVNMFGGKSSKVTPESLRKLAKDLIPTSSSESSRKSSMSDSSLSDIEKYLGYKEPVLPSKENDKAKENKKDIDQTAVKNNPERKKK